MLMKLISQGHWGYYRYVRMQLRVKGIKLRIVQLGEAFVILDAPVDHPPARGIITISIDGRVRRWPVILPDGMSAETRKQRLHPS
jgi:hypothetical protein